jgi:predicted unusual protein kinase regulating ubiquinone biosynthesis (AarF/ABC1/UbiB family)
MKVGQALSVMEAAIPEQYGKPYREALTKLQREAPPLAAEKVHRVLDGQLGTKWRERFASFDDTPVASASIGQVHKAVWSDGREVAVKIQYPGADEALRADLKTLGRFAGLFASVMPGVDVRPVIDEFTARTEEELDYRIEANNQRRFAKVYDGDPQFAVPHVVASAPKVVVTEWMSAKPLSAIIADGTPEELKSKIGGTYCQVTPANLTDVPRIATALAGIGIGRAGLEIDEDGGTVSVPAPDGVATLTEVLRRVTDIGVELNDVSLRKPSLDEVFLTLTGAPVQDATT